MAETHDFQPGRRIVVVGTSGSGKTTVAKRLAEALGLTYICSDAIIWGPNWTLVPHEQRVPVYDKATQAQSWTIDGNFGGTGHPQDELILKRADTLVWLDLSFRRVFSQLFTRTVRRAWTREELWHGNRESWRLSFFSRESVLLWTIRTFRTNRRRYAAYFADPGDARLQKIQFTRRRDLEAWLAKLESRAA